MKTKLGIIPIIPVAITMLGWASIQTVPAATLSVTNTADSSDPGTLRDALLHAAGGDTIWLPAGAVFQMGTIIDDAANFMGPTATPMITTAIIIEANGSRFEHLPNGVNFRVFAVGPGGNLTIRNAHIKEFTVKGGDGADGGGGGMGAGGAIYVKDGALTIEGSTFEGNGAAGGNGSIQRFPFPGGGGGGMGGNGGRAFAAFSPFHLTGAGGGGGGSRGNGGNTSAPTYRSNGAGGGGGGTVGDALNPYADTFPDLAQSAGGFACGGGGGGFGTDGADGSCPGGGGGGGGSPFLGLCLIPEVEGGGGGKGNYGGGGGGGGSDFEPGGDVCPESYGGGDGGHGGFGGGGGACAMYGLITSNHGGNGGFGGGGGAGANTEDPGSGGFFGGNASAGYGGGGGGLGGAIFNDGGTVRVFNCTFTRNFVVRGVSGGSPADNGADAGGAIFSLNGSLSVFNSTISGNEATGSGGGIVVLRVNGFDIFLPPPSASFTLRNTIIANNGEQACSAAGVRIGLVNYPVTTAGSGNLIQRNNTAAPGPGVVTTNGPLLGALQLNAPGLTPTMAIGAGSPALEAGDDANCEPFDQRGVARPQGAHCDIGAYEFGNSTPVAQCKDVTVSAGPSCKADASIDRGSFDPDRGDTLTLVQTPPGPYGLGNTPVKLTVSDSSGASSSCTAIVTVEDNTPPIVNCPGNVVTNATSPAGVVVRFPAASASDNCSAVTASCSPASGTTFTIGTNTVTCQATDGAGNPGTCTFTVVVKGAGQQIGDLVTQVQGYNFSFGTASSLTAKLQDASNLLTKGIIPGAGADLQSFINEANAQSGKKEITAAQSAGLVADATRIRTVMGL